MNWSCTDRDMANYVIDESVLRHEAVTMGADVARDRRRQAEVGGGG